MKILLNYINGKWIKSEGSLKYNVVNSLTAKTIINSKRNRLCN